MLTDASKLTEDTSKVQHICFRKLWKMDQKYLEMFEMWYWRRMEKISWTDHVRNKEVLRKVEKYPANNKKEVRLT